VVGGGMSGCGVATTVVAFVMSKDVLHPKDLGFDLQI